MSQKREACHCASCGSEIKVDDLYCVECGARCSEQDSHKNVEQASEVVSQEPIEPKKQRKNNAVLWAVIFLLSVVTVMLLVENMEMQDDLSYADRQRWDLQSKIAEMQGALSFYEQHVVFVSNDGSNVYHQYGCEEFDSSSFWAYNTELAEYKDYEPCEHCCD